MHLDKLEIHGFKSFRDKTVIKFPKSFTTIVGPNGSGKSNLTEATCFVLGKSRGLRANKLTELIFNGGVAGKGAKYAAVSLYLDLDGKQMKITRKISDKGQSSYRLNDKLTTRQKILDLVGDNEYNIILQDDVTRVIDMTPRERRQLIDELCGISEYDKKKEKALTELEKVEDKISELNIIMGEKKVYLTELKQERDDAIQYQSLQNELRECEASLIHRNLVNYEEKNKKIAIKTEELEDEKRNVLLKVEEVDTKVSGDVKTLKEMDKEILELKEKSGGARIIGLQSEISLKKSKIRDLNEKLENVKHEIYKKTDRKVKLGTQIHELTVELEKTGKILTKLNLKIEEKSKQLDPNLEQKIDEIKTKIYDLKFKRDTISEIKRVQTDEIDNLRDKKASIKSQIKDLLWEEQKIAREIDDIAIKHKSDDDEIEKLKKNKSNMETKLGNIRKDIENLRIKFAKNDAELKILEKGAELRSVSEIMKLKEKNGMSGIYGSVAQLGEVSDSRYELALQVAAGNRLNNIVVENVDIAIQCIANLRNKRVGVATFLPLNKLDPKIDKNLPAYAIGFARDFIVTGSKFRPVFDQVLGNTLLVKDIESAKSIGMKKYRMVTLDGDLLERSGAMIGGYRHRKKGAGFLNISHLKKELENIKKRINELEKDEEKILGSTGLILRKLSILKESIGDEKIRMEQLKLKKASLFEKRNELKEICTGIDKKINELTADMQKKEKEIKDMQNVIDGCDKSLDKLIQKRAQTNLDKIEELKDEKRDLDVKYNRLDEKIGLMNKQLIELKDEIKILVDTKKQTEKQIDETSKLLSELKEKLHVEEKKNEGVTNEINRLIDKKSKIEEHIESLGAKKGEFNRELDDIAQKFERLLIERTKIETKLLDLGEEFAKYEGIALIDKGLNGLKSMILEIEDKLNEFGAVNMRAIENYELMKKELAEITDRLGILKKEQQSIFDFMETVERKKQEIFMDAFKIVNENFKEIFSELSEGEGRLILDNSNEISDAGLLIEASPKGKKILNLDAMSGGEKVLTSSAFLLAIQRYKPSSFYMIDELDAALDKENSLRLANMLKNSGIQSILITHNDSIIKYADAMIGISMQDGISQVVGVKLT